MISANLQQWIQHPETLNKDTLYELRTLVTRYPYFQSLRLLYLKNLYLLHDISFGAELRKAILHVADRRKLFYLIEGERYILKPRKKNALPETEVLEEEPSLDRTLSLIDAFLATVPEEVSAQTSLDYATDLSKEVKKKHPSVCNRQMKIKLSPKRKRARRIMKKMKMIAVSPKHWPKYTSNSIDIPRHLKLLKN